MLSPARALPYASTSSHPHSFLPPYTRFTSASGSKNIIRRFQIRHRVRASPARGPTHFARLAHGLSCPLVLVHGRDSLHCSHADVTRARPSRLTRVLFVVPSVHEHKRSCYVLTRALVVPLSVRGPLMSHAIKFTSARIYPLCLLFLPTHAHPDWLAHEVPQSVMNMFRKKHRQLRSQARALQWPDLTSSRSHISTSRAR
ncbi:hypothetical protein HYPSUDRAFT_210413 [Hypholoma sublateritium FD-334 SS-4]|uniref:Uncharacterized protein n=1 Tax=Hypholoma sublateritium (strain FD-334 SS-4) TaxID=945553 RepID=A0A0D2NVE6_HYPSF|nr:hypothetical protein HYPSUDRAFT_210413 [Hypholoma sublateritium FD-334 SS-4]